MTLLLIAIALVLLAALAGAVSAMMRAITAALRFEMMDALNEPGCPDHRPTPDSAA